MIAPNSSRPNLASTATGRLHSGSCHTVTQPGETFPSLYGLVSPVLLWNVLTEFATPPFISATPISALKTTAHDGFLSARVLDLYRHAYDLDLQKR